MKNSKKIFPFLLLLFISQFTETYSQNIKVDGYKGIWFTLGQFSEYGDKYSGGLGTYTANHIPIAVYSPVADKTFFVYGGTTKAEDRHLLIMISWFDHKTGMVPNPVIVFDKEGVNDPHDNAALSIDKSGYVWVFVSGRGRTRPGIIFRSRKPYNIDSFDRMVTAEMTYPQPHWSDEVGFINLFTKYTKGRELYWSSSADGKNWTPEQKLAGMGGHYQVSNMRGNKIVSAFNYHPGGNVDKRTNLYCVQTEDFGKTWTSIDGTILAPPLTDPKGQALVRDFESENRLVYINDLNFDKSGNPVILAVISGNYKPGPAGDPREWMIVNWKDGKWNYHKVCESTHNYDMGSLYIENEIWKIIGPTEAGPQKYGTGGEVAMWISSDEGLTWNKSKSLTNNSVRNNSYVRRPINAHKNFYGFWADGNADTLSESHLYFTNKKGDRVWELPYDMKGDFEKPKRKLKN